VQVLRHNPRRAARTDGPGKNGQEYKKTNGGNPPHRKGFFSKIRLQAIGKGDRLSKAKYTMNICT
jgi:hypothetical protein